MKPHEVVHLGPAPSDITTRCCRRATDALPLDDRITAEPRNVTCSGVRDPRTGRFEARFVGAPWMAP